MSATKKALPKKRRFGWFSLFLLLFLLFLFLGFPWRELKVWAVTKAARQAGVRLTLRNVSPILPLGLRLEGARFERGEGAALMATPAIERLALTVPLLKLLKGEREVILHLRNGGTLNATLRLRKGEIEYRADGFDVGGLLLGGGEADRGRNPDL